MIQNSKLQVSLRSSMKEKSRSENPKKLRKQLNSKNVIYNRSSSLPVQKLQDPKIIDLREKIVNRKNCLSRPTSQKQKQSQMFTEKCLQILSRKKASGGNEKHRNKMRQMMDNIIDKYKSSFSRKMEITPPTIELSQTNSQSYNKMVAYEDKIEVYRTIRSTEIPKQTKPKKQKYLEWREKPDITGVRINKLLKSQSHDIQGVTCFSMAISENPVFKRQSLVVPSGATIERVLSSSSSRRKVCINKVNTQKFMAFSMNSDPDALYMKKLKSFLDFLFKINYSNKVYVSLQLSEDLANIYRYKVFIGRGNNSLLIKSLLKRRFWLQIVDSVDEDQQINFYWSQNKINKVHYRQPLSKSVKQLSDKTTFIVSKRKDMKISDQVYDLNKKVLSPEDSVKVEKCISKDGFLIPYEENHSVKVMTNHLPQNACIGSKKNLFKSLFNYYSDFLKINPFEFIPKTYNVKSLDDPQFKRFVRQNKAKSHKVWIVKPGQNTNRGNGIKLAQFSNINSLIKKEKHSNGQTKTYIIQSYINKPFLYNGRKFDIRHFMLLTSVNGILKAYWYKEGYLRTSSQKFDLDDLDNKYVHLTNDSIQKKGDYYEKYEPGNKLSYTQFQRHLDLTYPGKGLNFEKDIINKMRTIMLDVIKANYQMIDNSRRQSNFQIFGFDFMIDHDFKPWLIEINANPCLQINCHLMSRIVPVMVENSLRIGLDPLFPPFNHYPVSKRYTLSDNYLRNLKYELLFDEATFEDSFPVFNEIQDSDDEQQQYNDDGKEIQELLM